MARSYANIFTAIWRDPDFRALDGEAQRVYLLLVTQPNISAAGVLPMTVGRWAALASDTTAGQIRNALQRLTARHFIVTDDETEEVFARSFIRHDNGYRNSKRIPVIRDAARDIESRALRQALAAELARLDLPVDWIGGAAEPDGPPDRPSHGPSTQPAGPDTESAPRVDTESSQQVDSLSDRPSDGTSASERVVVTQGPYLGPPTHNPQSATPPPALAALDAEPPPPALFIVPDPGTDLEVPENANAGAITKEWIDYCSANGVKMPTSIIKRYGKHIKQALGQGTSDQLVRSALGAMFRDRVISRPALFDTYVIRAQQGPEMPPERLSRHQADAERRAPDGISAAARLHNTLTRDA